MAFPEGFQFTDNAKVNVVIEAYAALMFGREWRHRDDLMQASNQQGGWVKVPENVDGWRQLRVRKIPATATYEVCCLKGGEFEDPAPGVPAKVVFLNTGAPANHSHFSSSIRINPPDGAPSHIDYGLGNPDRCWYVTDHGNFCISPSTKEEITKRRVLAKRVSATALCDGSQDDIVALSAGNPKNYSHEIITPQVLLK